MAVEKFLSLSMYLDREGVTEDYCAGVEDLLCYLINNHEGDVITEESLIRWATEHLKKGKPNHE